MPSLSVQDLTVGERDGFAELVVRLDAPSGSAISVGYTSEDVTARGSTDYVYPGGTLNFAPGETSKTVRVPLRDDALAEGPESWLFKLRDPVGATISRANAAVNIVDDDTLVAAPTLFVDDLVVDEKQGTASFVVRLGRVYGETAATAVSVGYATRDAGATAAQDYVARSGTLTFQPGESVKTLSIDLVDDGVAEGLERFELVLANPVGAQLGDASALASIGLSDGLASVLPRLSVADTSVCESDGYALLVITLSAPSTQTISVGYTSEDVTARGSTDHVYPGGTLTFAPGETTKTVRVPLRDDLVAEGLESWIFYLRDAVNATLARAKAVVAIVDDDTLVEMPQLYVSDVRADEKQGSVSFVVRLGQFDGEAAAGKVTVDYATRDGSAQAGQDYVARSGTLVFQPGETLKTVVVDLLDDSLAEGAERFALELRNPVGAALGDAAAVAEIGLSDTLASALPRASVADITVAENDGFVDVAVSLHAPSAKVVTLGYRSYDSTAFGSTDYVYPNGTLTFAPGETLKSVRVPLRNDLVSESLETWEFALRDPVNTTISDDRAWISIVDDDDAARPVASHGRGDDLYTLAAGLQIIEADDGGFDVVRSTSSYTVAAPIEGVVLTGSALNATGDERANFFQGNAQSNTIDGRGGIDTMAYAGARSGYTVEGDAGQQAVAGAGEGRDTLLSIERLRFADTVVAYDTLPGGHVWSAYALLMAAFDSAPASELLSRWTAQMDIVDSLRGVAQSMIDYYAPGVGDEVLVSHLWATVVGTPIGAADLDTYVGALRDGAYTQASLFELAATHALNTNTFAAIVGVPMDLDAQWFAMPAG